MPPDDDASSQIRGVFGQAEVGKPILAVTDPIFVHRCKQAGVIKAAQIQFDLVSFVLLLADR